MTKSPTAPISVAETKASIIQIFADAQIQVQQIESWKTTTAWKKFITRKKHALLQGEALELHNSLKTAEEELKVKVEATKGSG